MDIWNIWDTWLEMPFLSNFNTLVGILLDPTDLLESIENITFCYFSFISGTYKKGNIRSIFKKIWKMFVTKWNIKLCFISNWRKIVAENIRDCKPICMMLSLHSGILAKPVTIAPTSLQQRQSISLA